MRRWPLKIFITLLLLSSPSWAEPLSLPWGSGERALTLIPAAEEQPPSGPLSIAPAAAGGFWIHDSAAGRILRLDEPGQGSWSFSSPLGVNDLLELEGRLYAMSLINRVITTFDLQGKQLERLPLPSGLRRISKLRAGPQGEIYFGTGFQQSFGLGLPGARHSWPRLSHVDGLIDPEGAAAAQLLLKPEGVTLTRASAEQGKAEHLPLQGTQGIDSARLLYQLADGAALILVERMRMEGQRLRVARELRLHSPDGSLAWSRAPASRPLFLPAREFAVAGGKLYQLYPSPEDLKIFSYDLRGK